MNKNLTLVSNEINQLPNNIEAEQAVIGSVLTSNEILDDISSIISEINFYDPLHQKIYSAINNYTFFSPGNKINNFISTIYLKIV